MPEESSDIVISVLAVCFFTLMLMVVIIMLFRIYMKRKSKLLLEKKMMEVQFEQTLLQSQLEIQEQTFKHISGELHDNVNQVLSLVRINLNTINTEDQPKLERMDDLLGKAITDLRNLSHSLDTDHIRSKGWYEPVLKSLRDLETSGKYKVKTSIPDELPRIESEKGIILFRIVQESINNIIRHSGAIEVEFDVRMIRQDMIIRLADNGKGFNISNAQGVGLQNLRNRAKMIDAKLKIESAPGSGTQIILTIKT